MPEQNINPAAAKFISSLVKSLQILCNGQVDFNESIELVGHINVKVDKVLKFDYIVDEQVSKEGNDSSTTFLSNSYHSSPPSRHNTNAQNSSETRQDTLGFNIPESHNVRGRSLHSDSDIRRRDSKGASASQVDTRSSRQDISYGFPYSVEASSSGGEKQQDDVVIKLEGGGDSDDCMVLPASPDDYEPIEESSAAHEDVVSVAGPSAFPSDSTDSQFASHGKHTRQGIRKRRMMDQDPDEGSMDTKTRMYNIPAEYQASGSGWNCQNCGMTFNYPDELQCHRVYCQHQTPPQSQAHPIHTTDNMPLQNLPPSESPDACSCTICGCIFSNQSERLLHMNSEHGVNIYPCRECGEIFGSSRLLCQHKKTKHGDLIAQLICPVCRKTFTTALNLRGHMNMHQGLKPYRCRKCGNSFAYSQSKHRHQKLCNGTGTGPHFW